MPNHTTTILEVRGKSKKDVKAFVDAIKTGKKIERGFLEKELIDEYDFERLFPMPEELRGTISPTKIVSQEEYDKAVKAKKVAEAAEENADPFIRTLPITQEMSDRFRAEYGYDNWYDWMCENYGTKWGMYDVEFGGFDTRGLVAKFFYSTAWSPASQYFLHVSKQFPTLTFQHFYADEGGGFLGHETFKNGKCVEQTELDWDGDEGIELRERLGVYYPEDEEEECEEA